MPLLDLHISKSDDTPEIISEIDKGHLHISGRSFPENAYQFYIPLLTWVKEFVDEHPKKPLEIQFELDYFNSSSGRFILEMLTIFEQQDPRSHYRVKWLVDAHDELMIEKGGEFKSLVDLHIEIVSKEAGTR
ncbi:MAG: DUF1987 domain-containing protein [Flavobacteriales bacterium]|nr:DUF1987 domain-containing protein [Flavobacteriales bacterium]